MDSITNVRTQVVAGTNYFLTLMVGETDCPVQGDFSKVGRNNWTLLYHKH